jgi:L-lactate dehydrogenase complex protein LldG
VAAGPAVSEARAAILDRLRRSLPRTEQERVAAEAAVRARLATPTPNLLPARGQLDRDSRTRLFVDMAKAVGANVRELPTLADVPAAVSAYLRQHNLPQRVTVAPEPMLDRAGWGSQPLLRVRRGGARPEDAAGVTIAPAAVAETGTLLLASAPERPTLLAFLPETSVIVVFAGDIDGAYEQSWSRLRDTMGTPPRSVNLVTGPSRTADIAQQIELGAHGPRRLLILVIEQDLDGDG